MICLHLAYYNSGERIIRDVILQNREQLLRQKYLYPQATLINGAHENIYHELNNSKLYNPSLGNLDQLARNILSFKLRKPNGNVIISSSKLIYAPLDKLYDLVGILSQLGPLRVCISAPSQLNYLIYLWSITKPKEDVSFEHWASNCIRHNLYELNYFKAVQKIARLVNEKVIVFYNTSNLTTDKIVDGYLYRFEIKDRTKLNLSATKYKLNKPVDDEIEKVEGLLNSKYSKWNAALYSNFNSNNN